MMADMCMCQGLGCPLKKDCYRYTAPTYGDQLYFNDSPYENLECKCFIDNKKDKKNLLNDE
jgi:hypothetical protein